MTSSPELLPLTIGSPEETQWIEFRNTGNLVISGRIIPEDAVQFFAPIHQWLKDYSLRPARETHIEIDLEYFNTSAHRQLFEWLKNAISIPKAQVIWKYETHDDDNRETGEEIQDMLQAKFLFIAYDR